MKKIGTKELLYNKETSLRITSGKKAWIVQPKSFEKVTKHEEPDLKELLYNFYLIEILVTKIALEIHKQVFFISSHCLPE